jgi:CheY-like chemotaxis protein
MTQNNGTRVLVLDPDPSVRALLVALLHREGYAADAAANPDEALHLRRAVHHEAVIVEPRSFGGPAVLDALRDAVPGIPVNLIVVITAEPTASLYEKRTGVRAVLRKPFFLDELVGAVASCCEALH